MRTVSLSTLVNDTGETVRTLQYWSDLQILRPEPTSDRKGRGRAREYAAEPYFGERKWALVAAALNRLRLPVNEIRSVVDMVRKFGAPDFSKPGQSEREAIVRFEYSEFYSAIAGKGEALVLIGKSILDGNDCIDVHWLPPISKDMTEPRDAVVLDSPEMRFMNQINGFMREYASAHCLNLSKIFEPLRRSESLPEKVKATRP